MRFAINDVQWTLNVKSEDIAARETFSSLDRVFELNGLLVSPGEWCHVIKLCIDGRNYYVKRYTSSRKHLRKFFGPSRANNEHRNLTFFADLGIPVPLTVAYGGQRILGLFRRAALITEEVPSAIDLRILARTRPDLIGNRTWLWHLLRKLAEYVSRIHRTGFTHGDLKWRNILVTPDEIPRVYFIDCPNGTRRLRSVRRHFVIRDLANLDELAPQYISRSTRLRWYLWYRGRTKLTQEVKNIIYDVVSYQFSKK